MLCNIQYRYNMLYKYLDLSKKQNSAFRLIKKQDILKGYKNITISDDFQQTYIRVYKRENFVDSFVTRIREDLKSFLHTDMNTQTRMYIQKKSFIYKIY